MTSHQTFFPVVTLTEDMERVIADCYIGHKGFEICASFYFTQFSVSPSFMHRANSF